MVGVFIPTYCRDPSLATRLLDPSMSVWSALPPSLLGLGSLLRASQSPVGPWCFERSLETENPSCGPSPLFLAPCTRVSPLGTLTEKGQEEGKRDEAGELAFYRHLLALRA